MKKYIVATILLLITSLSVQAQVPECMTDLQVRAKDTKVQLVWNYTGGDFYTILRRTDTNAPYTFIADTDSQYSTYLDSSVLLGLTYFYRIVEMSISEGVVCQSPEVSVLIYDRVRVR